MQKTSKVVVLTPTDPTGWLTCYQDTQDIATFTASKKVTCLVSKADFYREISNAEYLAYDERKELALAEQMEANEQGGE